MSSSNIKYPVLHKSAILVVLFGTVFLFADI